MTGGALKSQRHSLCALCSWPLTICVPTLRKGARCMHQPCSANAQSMVHYSIRGILGALSIRLLHALDM